MAPGTGSRQEGLGQTQDLDPAGLRHPEASAVSLRLPAAHCTVPTPTLRHPTRIPELSTFAPIYSGVLDSPEHVLPGVSGAPPVSPQRPQGRGEEIEPPKCLPCPSHIQGWPPPWGL